MNGFLWPGGRSSSPLPLCSQAWESSQDRTPRPLKRKLARGQARGVQGACVGPDPVPLGDHTCANSWMLFHPRLPPPPHLLLETLCPCLPRSLSSFGLHHQCPLALLPPLWPCGLRHFVEASFSSPPHTSMPFRVPPQVLSSLPSNPHLCFCVPRFPRGCVRDSKPPPPALPPPLSAQPYGSHLLRPQSQHGV